MKTVTVEELGNPGAEVWKSVAAGEMFAVTEQGKVIARLGPADEPPASRADDDADGKVDWTTSAAFTMDKSGMRVLTAEESAALWEELRGSKF